MARRREMAKDRRAMRCHYLTGFGTEPDIGFAVAMAERCEQPAAKETGSDVSEPVFIRG